MYSTDFIYNIIVVGGISLSFFVGCCDARGDFFIVSSVKRTGVLFVL